MIHRLIKSFGYAFSGISYALKTQLNFKIHLATFVLTVIAGYWVKLSSTEWLFILLFSGMVLITELFNTAIEVLTDLVSPNYHSKAKAVKDVAAAGVLVAAISSIISGLIIFIPKVI